MAVRKAKMVYTGKLQGNIYLAVIKKGTSSLG